jgi:hypothetical protein
MTCFDVSSDNILHYQKLVLFNVHVFDVSTDHSALSDFGVRSEAKTIRQRRLHYG